MEILFFLSALISEIIGTIAGFGSSTVFLPLALSFVDFKTALTLVALFHLFGNLGRITFFRHRIDKKLLFTFGLPSILFTLIGALLVVYISQEFLKGILGIFLIFYSLIALWRENLAVKPTLFNSVFGGSLTGFITGLIGTGGAMRGAYLTAFGVQKEKYIATAAAIALMVDLTRIPVYFVQGFLESKFFWYIPVLLIMAFIGSFIGRKIIDKIAQKMFKKIVLLAILLIGLKFFFDWIV